MRPPIQVLSNPGPLQLRRLRRGTSSGPFPADVSSDEEPLVRPNMGRDVLPRFGEGPVAVPLAKFSRCEAKQTVGW